MLSSSLYFTFTLVASQESAIYRRGLPSTGGSTVLPGTTVPPVKPDDNTMACLTEDYNELTPPPPSTQEGDGKITELGTKALLACLNGPGTESISWGGRGMHHAKLLLYHQATQDRFLPPGWAADMAVEDSSIEIDSSQTHVQDDLETSTENTSSHSTYTTSTIESSSPESSSSSPTTISNHTDDSTIAHNVAGDGFEFPADRRDPRVSVYKGPNGLNRSLNGWKQYWTDPRDQNQVNSDFLDWAVSAANQENAWLQKYYADGIGQRIQRNTSGAQKLMRNNLSQGNVFDKTFLHKITYKSLTYPSDMVTSARLRVSQEYANHLVGSATQIAKSYYEATRRRLAASPGDTDDSWLPDITVEFTPPVWTSSSKSDAAKNRGPDIMMVKRWDSVPILKSPKQVDQVLENVVAVQEVPFYGVQHSDRDYFGKDYAEEENFMRPWDRLWGPKKIYSVYG